MLSVVVESENKSILQNELHLCNEIIDVLSLFSNPDPIYSSMLYEINKKLKNNEKVKYFEITDLLSKYDINTINKFVTFFSDFSLFSTRLKNINGSKEIYVIYTPESFLTELKNLLSNKINEIIEKKKEFSESYLLFRCPDESCQNHNSFYRYESISDIDAKCPECNSRLVGITSDNVIKLFDDDIDLLQSYMNGKNYEAFTYLLLKDDINRNLNSVSKIDTLTENKSECDDVTMSESKNENALIQIFEENKNNEENNIEELLQKYKEIKKKHNSPRLTPGKRMLQYIKETGQLPIDEENKVTKEYKKWKYAKDKADGKIKPRKRKKKEETEITAETEIDLEETKPIVDLHKKHEIIIEEKFIKDIEIDDFIKIANSVDPQFSEKFLIIILKYIKEHIK